MGSLGEILGRILEILTDLIPRPIYVPRSLRACMWILWWGPWEWYGPFIHWPVFMSYELIDTREDATPFEPTVLWTKDGKEVEVAAVLTWKIDEPGIAAARVNDISDFVGEKIESVLPQIVGQYELAELQRKAAGGEGREWALNRHLVAATKAMLQEYGISVLDARINFTARTRVLRVTGVSRD